MEPRKPLAADAARFDKWLARLPLWVRTVGLFVIGWLLTLFAITLDANGLTRRSSALILVGPVFTVVALVMLVKELWAKARKRRATRLADAPEARDVEDV